MSLNSSRAKTGIESMEDLFTLGHFEEAYELGEAEITARLAARRLPRALLQPRQAVAANIASSATSDSDSLQPSLTTSAHSVQGALDSTSKGSSSLPNSSSSSRGNLDSLSKSRNLEQRQSYPTGFGPHDADAGQFATSSTPYAPHTKPRDISYSTLGSADQEQLRMLVLESLPYLAVMVQCLFELNEKAMIPAFLKRLCGAQIEEYPFELAYLLINLYVQQKDYEQARPACEAMISQIRSVLGPLPLSPRSDILNASYEASKTESGGLTSQSPPSKAEIASGAFETIDSPHGSPSSAAGPSIALLDDKEGEEEDEAVAQLRHNFQSLLQLYIFHVLCETQRFADAKLFLFMESRLHPNIIQEWSVYIDNLEQRYIDDCKRVQEQRKLEETQGKNQPESRFIFPPDSSTTSSSSSQKHTNHQKHGNLSSSDGASSSSTGNNPNNTSVISAHLPLHRKIAHQFMVFYRFFKSRFDTLSPAQKTAFVALIIAAIASLVTLISRSPWVRGLGVVQWFSQQLGIAPPPPKVKKTVQRQIASSAASSNRMGYYGPSAPSRATLGAANRVPSYSPTSYTVPRHR